MPAPIYWFKMRSLPPDIYRDLEAGRHEDKMTQWQEIILALRLLKITRTAAPDQVAREVAITQYEYPMPGTPSLVREIERLT